LLTNSITRDLTNSDCDGNSDFNRNGDSHSYRNVDSYSYSHSDSHGHHNANSHFYSTTYTDAKVDPATATSPYSSASSVAWRRCTGGTRCSRIVEHNCV
jgi:hypothetical protein